MFSRKLIVPALATVAFAVPAFAADSVSLDEPATRAVSYGDLDLGSREGVQSLYGRLRYAARVVCTVHEGQRIEQRMAHRRCMNDALATAVREVDDPGLTAYAMRRDESKVRQATR